MANLSIKELVEAGVHFGHRASRWNPKMKPYIFGKRNLIHIIDLRETLKGLIRSARFLSRVAARGEDILFVGTKRQARNNVQAEATRCGMPYVVERWLGGTLTNFRTITSRVRRLEELEELESSGRIDLYSKKMVSSFQRETAKIRRNLEGIRNMKRLPGALVIIDPHHEKIAVAEARKLGIPVVCMTDTDSDPDVVDILTPANDDAIRSIQLYARRMADAVIEGRKTAPKAAARAEQAEEKPADRGRGRSGEKGGARGGDRRKGGAPRKRTSTKTTQRMPGGKSIEVERAAPSRGGRGRRGEEPSRKSEAAEEAAPEASAEAPAPEQAPASDATTSES